MHMRSISCWGVRHSGYKRNCCKFSQRNKTSKRKNISVRSNLEEKYLKKHIMLLSRKMKQEYLSKKLFCLQTSDKLLEESPCWTSLPCMMTSRMTIEGELEDIS